MPAHGLLGSGSSLASSRAASVRSSQATEEDTQPTASLFSASPESSPSDANDVAVIGFACRAPGGNNSPEQLWDFLLNKGDASGDIPNARWESYRQQPKNAKILSTTTSKGYFLDRLEDFDAAFFGISPREAEQIDPQQRTSLEVAWEALEHAGIPPHSLSGSDTAVFMGVGSDDYGKMLLEDLPNVEAWMGVGTAFCGVPNRISYFLDLRGPSSAVDAACASSLVAIHHGRQALLAKETSLAIVGGVNALSGPGLTRVLDEAGAISQDGRCRSFDKAAAGYGRGEGAGIVILKRLVDAIEDENNILAVLKGSAVGADGRTNGIMAPNQEAQEQVARKALKEARLSADSVGYVEAHATSTPLGDPTECAAMANVYGYKARDSSAPHCFIGSIKPNVGHLEAGAGVLGFIKAIMTVQNGIIPPQANLETLNPNMDWNGSMLRPVTEATPWGKHSIPRRAAIASYGYGGTVSHAVIEAAPIREHMPYKILSRTCTSTSPTILLLSAPQPLRIKNVAARLLNWFQEPRTEQESQKALDSAAYTLAAKRGHHTFRTSLVVHNMEEAVKLLGKLTQGQNDTQIASGRAYSPNHHKGAVWCFSGHGAQWKSMGQGLIHEPVFLDVVQQVEPIIQKESGFSAIEAFKSGDFDTSERVQIMTFIMQVGLATILKAGGARPRACVGHSLGEIAASVVAGAITLTEGALVCCVRARLYRAVAGSGMMVLVSLPFSIAADQIGTRGDVSVAIDSSPSSCVVAGTVKAVKELVAEWKQNGVSVRVIKSDIAFHSPILSPLAEPLRQALAHSLNPRMPEIPLYSTTLPDPRSNAKRDVEYWVENMMSPVLLTSAINAATADGYRVFLEVSSHPIITHSINETLLDANVSEAVVVPTLSRDCEIRNSLLLALGKLYCAGDVVEFSRCVSGSWSQDVPRTKWEHQPYWRKVAVSEPPKPITHNVHHHVLLGQQTLINGTDNTLWQTCLDAQSKPFPGRHPLHGVEIVPAAVLLNTFLSAAPGRTLQNVALRVPVVVEPPREVQVLMNGSHVRISSRLLAAGLDASSDHSWLTNTKVELATVEKDSSYTNVDLFKLQRRLTTRLSSTFSVDYLAKVGVAEMGFPWTVLEHFEQSNEMLAQVEADPVSGPSKHWGTSSWASILDAATSISSTIFYKEPLLRMPTAIKSVTLRGVSAPKVSYIYVKRTSSFETDVQVLDEQGNVLVDIRALKFAGIEGNVGERKSDVGLVYRIAWPPAQLVETPLNLESIVFIAAEDNPLLQGYRDQLQFKGIKSVAYQSTEAITNDLRNCIIVHIADAAQNTADVYSTLRRNCDTLLSTVKTVVGASSPSKVFCITQNVAAGSSFQALSQSSLLGLARIIHSEEPRAFGGLVDVEDTSFPFQAIKYVKDVDVIRIEDSVARQARLRPFSNDSIRAKTTPSFHIRPQGTYLVTGGMGALGLEVVSFLVKKGAKRIVLVSRRKLPPRRLWDSHTESAEIQRLLAFEKIGVTIHTIAVNMADEAAAHQLQSSLDMFSLPPILGVVHAAGVLANQLVIEATTETFHTVLAPKTVGAMALHELFPPNSLDFMILFSSCGQLLGFPGQASYASGNAFLDNLATHRRSLGDNTISMMWTSWRGLGMAASTKYIDAELSARHITDITKEEAFAAWEQAFRYDTDHAVVLRTIPLEADEDLQHPILSDCIEQKYRVSPGPENRELVATSEPAGGEALEKHLTRKVTQCVASTLGIAEDSVDPNAALLELGMDSILTVELRGKLQKAVGTKVGSTLIWNCPTVAHLVRHFVAEKTT